MPGAAPPKVPGGPGAQVFANNGCGGCHTLAAAKSGGTTGPNLDEVLSGQSAAMIEESIVDPNAKIAKGYPANVMPVNFGETLSPKELEDLVQYLVEETGGEGRRRPGGKARPAEDRSQGRLSRPLPRPVPGRWHYSPGDAQATVAHGNSTALREGDGRRPRRRWR